MMLDMEGADEMTLVSFALGKYIRSKIKNTIATCKVHVILNAFFRFFEVVNKDYWFLQENTVSVFLLQNFILNSLCT